MLKAIEVKGLKKSYGDFQALRGVDLEVEEGEIVAFLGPNGAGKTSTIEILEGFRTASSGEVKVLGHDPQLSPLELRAEIGIVLQESEPVPELTAFEAVKTQAAYFADARDPDEVLNIVGLSDSASHRTRKLSGGQKRRLDLALALVGNPKLVFLDEPTTGFDPSARRESWAMIEALRDLGTTVLLTTHYMDEAEHLADRIVVIADGLVVAKGTSAQLADSVAVRPVISWNQDVGTQRFPGEEGPLRGQADTNNASLKESIETTEVVSVLNELTGWSIENQVDIKGLQVSQPSLEDVYLKLCGSSIEKGGAR